MAAAAQGASPRRRLFIDWARGLAVLCMIEHHAFDAWMPDAFHGSAPDRLFRWLGGVAAPTFLFLAGLAMVLMMEGRLARGGTRTAAALGAAKRGGLIFLGAYLFRFQEWALAFGGSPPGDMLRIDVLNCIGVSLVLLAALWGLCGSAAARALALFAAATAVVAAAPLVWAAPLAGLPQVLADYLHGLPPRALFPLFPWIGFTFAGGLVGLAFARARAAAQPARAEARLIAALSLGALALWFATRAADRLDFHLYAQLDWWRTSPAYFLLRCCSEIWILAGCWLVERTFSSLWARLPAGPLVLLGRHSLLIYWVHIEIVYGRWFWSWRGHLSLPRAVLCLALLLASQVGLAWSIDPIKAWLKRKASGFRLPTPASAADQGGEQARPSAQLQISLDGSPLKPEAGSR